MLRHFTLLLSVFALLLLAACGSEEQPASGDDHEGHDHHDGADHDHDHGDEGEEMPAFVMPDSGRVFFIAPEDGATVSSPFSVSFGVEGVTVKAAGPLEANTGHHHIIINGGPIEPEGVIPADDMHLHYGAGQTETELSLEPGEYTLTMQLADGIHRSYGEKFAATIKVTVE